MTNNKNPVVFRNDFSQETSKEISSLLQTAPYESYQQAQLKAADSG